MNSHPSAGEEGRNPLLLDAGGCHRFAAPAVECDALFGGILVELPAQLFAEIAGYTQIRVERRHRERRKFARSPLSYRAMVVRIAGGTASEPTQARIRDISPGGIGILHSEAAKDGEELYVRLPRRRGESTWVGGIVVHCRLVERGLYRIGLSFSRLIGLRHQTRVAAVAG